MTGWLWAALVGGVVLAVWSIWQHRGRSAAARAWTHDWMGSFKVKSVLVLRPLLVVVLILGGLMPLASHWMPVQAVFSLLILVSLAGIVAYFLPLPVPSFAMPKWYREQLASSASLPRSAPGDDAPRGRRAAR